MPATFASKCPRMKCRPGARQRVRSAFPSNACPSGRRRAAALATALCAVLGPSVASAEEAVTIEVQCDQLSREELAAVEARSRTELIVRRIDSGHLALRCEEAWVSASFMREPSVRTELREPRSEPNVRADQLVALVGQLFDEATGAQEAAPTSPAKSTTPAPPTRPRSSTKPAPVPEDTNVPPERADAWESPSAAAPAPNDSRGPSLLVGGALELWQTEIAGTAGVLVGGSVPLGRRVAVRLSANLAWGTSQTEGISARHFLAEGAFEVPLSSWALGSLGGGVSALTFDSETLLTDESTTALSPVAHLALRLTPGGRSGHFTLGPIARYFAKPREVTVLGSTVLHAPRWSVALELEGRFDLSRGTQK